MPEILVKNSAAEILARAAENYYNNQMFGGLIGNLRAKEAILRMRRAGRIPGALLFSGPDGVGKRLFALQVAKSFLCRAAVDFDPCGQCPICLRIERFAIPEAADKTKDEFKQVFFSEHPDVGMVTAYNRNILIDAIRDLEREANFRPFEGDYRFFIIDDAEKMGDAAANALLKTLEEPPATSHIFLITSRPESLQPTIRSRCQTIRFTPLDPLEIAEFLAKSGGHPKGAALAARIAGGSIGRAMSLDLEKFGPLRSAMLGILENTLFRGDLAALLQASEAMNDAKNKENFELSLEILETLVRDIWLIRNGAEPEMISNFDLMDGLSRFASEVEAERLAGWLSEIEGLRQSLAVNINRKIAADALLMKMAVG